MKIKDLLALKRKGMLTVNPEYQRGAVWAEAQQKRLVDSVMRGYPLPLIYLHYKKVEMAGLSSESLEIIDGQQRIDALYAFAEKGIKLFDPTLDDKKARFPDFTKNIPCPWGQKDYRSLPEELRVKFDETDLFIVRVTTDNEDEARDLFIRLQAGLPLNPQEKRDAWPGGYTEFTLQFGGKSRIDRYPGHEFFSKWVATKSNDRGELRTLCAQLGMLFFEKATEGNWMDIGTQQIDDYYYQNLGFKLEDQKVTEFTRVLNLIVSIFNNYNGPKLKVHEAIHIMLLVSSIMDDYTKEWQQSFTVAFDQFRQNTLVDKKRREGEYWFKYGSLTSTQASSASTIQRRHSFFMEKMLECLKLVRKDDNRIYGKVEREIIFYRDKKQCAVCGYEVNWQDLEIHHVDEHQRGGQTTIENGVAVHKQCHPKGQDAIEFYEEWKERKTQLNKLADTLTDSEPDTQSNSNKPGRYKIEIEKKGILAYATVSESGKFQILKGSTISKVVSESFAASNSAPKIRRDALIADGSIDAKCTFTRDVLFSSKSNAAGVVLGFSANGNASWLRVED